MTKTVRASKVRLNSNKIIARVVRNVLDLGNGFFEGTISVAGETLIVQRKKHARSWRQI